jgi:hypothetical protein
MTLNFVQASIVGENGHIRATDGELDWTVIVTREAVDAVSNHHGVSIEDLLGHSPAFLAVAEERLSDGDVAGDRIWVMEKDVRGWMESKRFRQIVGFPTVPGIRQRPPALTSAHALSLAAIRLSRARARLPIPPR